MAHTIELRKVSKYYATEDSVSMGFSRVDLNLDIGEFVAITGESGSGKSTLLNVISGLDTYEEGEMFVCGEDTTAYSTEDYERYRKTYIGNIFQDFNLINSYTVYQNIELVMLLGGKKKKECRARILELLDMVGLSEYRNTKASRLSGGQKQRVAIARALAKDAPIIVADEPTGNLDSASAESIMAILSEISKDKLVVIVTHNYEQAEPYVTRKLTMHDGKIIEDKHFSRAGARQTEPETVEFEVEDGEYDSETGAPVVKGMRKSSEARLGVRNTFNIPAKFILLFIVYFFVSTAVLSQYATTKNSLHEEDLLGTNPYFTNTSSDRIIVKKADESAFTDADFDAVQNSRNIRSIVRNDLAIDNGVSFVLGDFYIEGSVYPQSELAESELTFGHMPENDYEIVIKTDASSDAYFSINAAGESLIGTTVNLQDMGQMQVYEFSQPITIAGVIIEDDAEDESDYSMYGYSTIYVSDTVSNELMISLMAEISGTVMNFGGTKIDSDYERAIYSSPKVPEGKAYIFEDQTYYYKDGEAAGKDLGLTVKNRFFESSIGLKVDQIITADNIKKLLDIDKENFDMYYNCVYISEADFDKLFDKGYFQISAFMQNETDSEETIKALNGAGFTTLALKDSLSDMTGGYSLIIQMVNYGRLAIEFIVLFFIAYAVIKLIMRSRNSYYSTLRILGATKKNTDTILRIELIIMMVIAYAVDIVFVAAVKLGYINNKSLTQLLYFLTVSDYVMLGIVLLALSLLIANRYSRKIFSKSAMKAFREEG
ncbi:MAG: ABC transporter ATP-binding protein [Mogibacterium sp.]|nr:ABC transporter ATP-binding protein [Mogibacterium sp.]